jgi:hypothetical protein
MDQILVRVHNTYRNICIINFILLLCVFYRKNRTDTEVQSLTNSLFRTFYHFGTESEFQGPRGSKTSFIGVGLRPLNALVSGGGVLTNGGCERG